MWLMDPIVAVRAHQTKRHAEREDVHKLAGLDKSVVRDAKKEDNGPEDNDAL